MVDNTSNRPVPLDWSNEAEHRRKIAESVNKILDGKINATGSLTLEANSPTTTLNDGRIGLSSVLLLQPKTSNAAATMSSWHISSRASGSITFSHPNNAQTDRTFDYLVVG